MKTKLLILALFTTMLAACGPGPDPVLELKLTEEEQIFNSRQNQAGIDLLCLHASDEEENTIISPLSINIASAMLANGAKNATQEQILNAIGAEGYSIDFLNDYNVKLMKTLPHLDQTTDMRIANGIWLDDNLRPVENFVEVNKRSYQATVDIIDLNKPAAAKVINDWASLNTKKLIQQVVDESMFNDYTRFVLANAIYFKGCWQSEFKKADTRKGDFHLADGTTIQTDMMHQTGKFKVSVYISSFTGTPKGRMLRMPFKGEYYMDIILPNNEVGGCENYLERVFNMDELNALEKTLTEMETYVQMPKFTLKYHRDLNDDMKTLGMTDAFSGQLANFSGIAEEPLYLSKLFQDSFLEVDEAGAKAAAVTVATMNYTSAEPDVVPPFIVNRPFLLFIRECTYGTILFAGKIGHPESK